MTINLVKYQKILAKIVANNKKNTELLVVSKNKPLEDLIPLIKDHKHQLFGENRVQEAKSKFPFDLIQRFDLKIHLIGPLQTNKVDVALNFFHTIQSIDRLKLVNEIHKSISKNNFPTTTKDYFLQVNIGEEPQKSGVEIHNLPDLYERCLKLNLNIVGLMCIPPINDNPVIYFEKMVMLRDNLNPLLNLSMGMSGDYEEAIKFKSNMVRIGSLLFS